MLKDAEVGVESGYMVFEPFGAAQCQTGEGDAGAGLLRVLREDLHVADGPVGRIYPARLDDAADDRHPFLGFLNVYFVRMQIHVEFVLQENADLVDGSQDILLPACDERHVIDKSHVFAMETLHESQGEAVQNREEEGAEELRSDVADRHAPVRRGIEAALLRVEMLPQVNPSASLAICFGDVHQGDVSDP